MGVGEGRKAVSVPSVRDATGDDALGGLRVGAAGGGSGEV